MKKITTLAMTAALVLSLGAVAFAGPWGPGGGYGPGNCPAWGAGGAGGTGQQLTTEQQAALDKNQAEFLKATQDLRIQMTTKRIELQTLYAQPNADPAKVKALSDELVDLRAALAKKGNEFRIDNPELFAGGPGFGRGRGAGMGRGFGGGYGPGACWR